MTTVVWCGSGSSPAPAPGRPTPHERVAVIWLALFVGGAVAGLIGLKVFPGHAVESSRTDARAPRGSPPEGLEKVACRAIFLCHLPA